MRGWVGVRGWAVGRRASALRPGGRRRGALRVVIIPRVVLLAVAGCGGTVAGGEFGPPSPASSPSQSPSSPTDPAGAVAMFLDAANQRDHAAMARLFGTEDGPIGERGGALGCAFRKTGSWIGLGERCLEEREVELRMDVIAEILRHDSHRVVAEERVAGRGRPATRVGVEMVTGGRGVVVPFVVIEAGDGRWLVQEIGLDRLVR